MAIRDLGLPPDEPQKPYLVPPRKTSRAKKIVFWITGVVDLLLLLLAIGIYAALHSVAVHNYVVKTAQQKASQSLNHSRRVAELRAAPVDPGTRLIRTGQFTVSAPAPNQPTLLSRSTTSVWACGSSPFCIVSGTCRNVAVDHPVVKLIVVDSNGQSNLYRRFNRPATPTPTSSILRFATFFSTAARFITTIRRPSSTPISRIWHSSPITTRLEAADISAIFLIRTASCNTEATRPCRTISPPTSTRAAPA